MSTIVKRKGEGVKTRGEDKSVSKKKESDSCVSDGLSASEFEGGFKRPRVISPVEVISFVESMSESEVEGKMRKKVSKSKKERSEKVVEEKSEKVEVRVPKTKRGMNVRMREITNQLVGYLKDEGIAASIILGVREITDRFEELLVESMLAREHLKGQVEALEKGSRDNPSPVVVSPSVNKVVSEASSGSLSTSLPVSVAVSRPSVSVPKVLPKPVETWSVVVRGKKGDSGKEVVKKVQSEVGPSLGVRVHDIFPLKNGGAVIRTPSVAERQKVAANAKFGEVGLEVSVRDKLGPRVVVQGLPSEVPVEEFMTDLYSLNFERMMSLDEFKGSVRMVSTPWQAKDGVVSVVLEGSTQSMQHLLAADRCYIKWFACRVRTYDQVPACHRCLGWDHRVRECKVKEDICRHCGQAGHIAKRCNFSVRCRNCALRGYSADHSMFSSECPIYGARLARVNSRH